MFIKKSVLTTTLKIEERFAKDNKNATSNGIKFKNDKLKKKHNISEVRI